jgi:hypothetical protein
MNSKIKQGFERKLVTLAIADLHFTKTMSVNVKQGRKYSQILSSIREVGLIEPPVAIFSNTEHKYLLLDGHLRIMALRELGEEQVKCLISVDDEGYTYNKFINRISVVQEHKMIMKALNDKVSEEKLALSLNLDMKTIRYKINMLDGVCPEAIDLLKDKIMSIHVFQILKKMKPMRQIKVARLMNDQNRYGQTYARVLLDGTSADQLVDGAKKKRLSPAAVEKRMRLEEESIALDENIRALNDSYGKDMLYLNIIQSCLKRWMHNEKVANYLQKYHPEIHEKIFEIASLDFFKLKSTG